SIEVSPVDGPATPFEAAVSLAASVALLLLQRGYQVGLATSGNFLAPAAGRAQAGHILKHLALVELQPPDGTGPALSGPALRGAAVLRVLQGQKTPRLESARPVRPS
ncbi:MAG TPA: hypothetical protein VF518_08940, partial [Polyangia bacterium]